MTVFNQRFYIIGQGRFIDCEGYDTALTRETDACSTKAEIEKTLKNELNEMTRHIIDGLQELATHQECIQKLVSANHLPLASWSDYLQKIPEESLEELETSLLEMRKLLEHTKDQEVIDAMTLYGKPSFTDFDEFYDLIFKKLIVLKNFS